MTECRWCKEGNKPEWSTDAQVWIHRRESLDRRCENPPVPYDSGEAAFQTTPTTVFHFEELNVSSWKQKISDLGQLAQKAYFLSIQGAAQSWEKLTLREREAWAFVGHALAEVLCPHDSKTVTSAGHIWCNKCGLQIPKEKL